ncbi:hypothetical protein HPB47_017575 [Ixodes persulcatus]|uniref:Uncharacterized protein n=1 Tax=Ixodes persulcatus TaxID=34615 RepID=A0AC60QMY1_IXOPE|nr:hypothetical protein HPB47_017575 [Ixodes persulcatus]
MEARVSKPTTTAQKTLLRPPPLAPPATNIQDTPLNPKTSPVHVVPEPLLEPVPVLENKPCKRQATKAAPPPLTERDVEIDNDTCSVVNSVTVLALEQRLEANDHDYTILNDFSYPTRIGNCVTRNTFPDLSMARKIGEVSRTNTEIFLGSDHYVLEILVPVEGISAPAKRKVVDTNWDAFLPNRNASAPTTIEDLPGVLHVDAAPHPGSASRNACFAIAVATSDGFTVAQAFVTTEATAMVKEAAVALAQVHAGPLSTKVTSDSKTAVCNFAKGRVCAVTERILRSFTPGSVHTRHRLVWFPTHSAHEGNETAHARATRATSFRMLAGTLPSSLSGVDESESHHRSMSKDCQTVFQEISQHYRLEQRVYPPPDKSLIEFQALKCARCSPPYCADEGTSSTKTTIAHLLWECPVDSPSTTLQDFVSNLREEEEDPLDPPWTVLPRSSNPHIQAEVVSRAVKIATDTTFDPARTSVHRPISSATGIGRKTVGRIIEAYRDEQLVDDARGTRAPATSNEEDLLIVADISDDPFLTVPELESTLNLRASRSTIERCLHEAGLCSRIAAQMPCLYE